MLQKLTFRCGDCHASEPLSFFSGRSVSPQRSPTASTMEGYAWGQGLRAEWAEQGSHGRLATQCGFSFNIFFNQNILFSLWHQMTPPSLSARPRVSSTEPVCPRVSRKPISWCVGDRGAVTSLRRLCRDPGTLTCPWVAAGPSHMDYQRDPGPLPRPCHLGDGFSRLQATGLQLCLLC